MTRLEAADRVGTALEVMEASAEIVSGGLDDGLGHVRSLVSFALVAAAQSLAEVGVALETGTLAD